ncbi:MAG: hypothetical protein QI199_00235, partial [Candidatus Korarchaeota archaeon]|nr:hypothetical protein [Candidatus Korarchaeota archaeon]
FYTLTPRDALLRARKAVEEDLGMLEAWSTWHQRIMVWSASTIMGVLIYPLVYGATWRIVWRAGASMPSWLLLAVDLTATILLWRLFHLYVRGIVVHRGVHRGAALVAVPVALLASYAVLAMLGIVPVDPIYYALGLRPPSSRGDVLSSVWSNEAMRRSLEGMFKEFERVARIVVRLLWG